jgi:hypothetical protein
VDVASTRALNVRISKHNLEDDTKHALLLAEVESFNELDALMRRYQVNVAAIDHLPDGRLSRAFAERWPGRVFVVSYNTAKTPTNAEVIKIDEQMHFVTVRRTEAMDATAEAIRAQRNHLPRDLPAGYVEAMQAPVRVVTQDELGRKIVRYQSMGQDDWFHSEVYDEVAAECWWFRQVREEQARESLRPLEEMLEFERSDLSDPEAELVYNPGGVEDDGYYGGGRDQGY